MPFGRRNDLDAELHSRATDSGEKGWIELQDDRREFWVSVGIQSRVRSVKTAAA